MHHAYDVIVVGARCAGAPTAMLLARKGYRVLLLDRATFPSDTLSSHFIRFAGMKRLHKWGLLERVLATGAPPIYSGVWDLGDFEIAGEVSEAEGVPPACAPRRIVLDRVLQEASVEAGVEFRQGFNVQQLVWEGERVAGVKGRAEDGEEVTVRAKIVVGADGRHSMVARCAGAEVYNEHPALLCWYYTYWAGVESRGLEHYWRGDERRVILAFPTNDEQMVVIIGWPREEFPVVRADIERHYRRALSLAPGLAERISEGRQAERFFGTVDVPNYFRRAYGPGWALAGDAGHNKDPLTAWGIKDAFRDADLLAEAIDAGLSGQVALDEALAEYERQRDGEAIEPYERLIGLAAQGQPDSKTLAVRRAIRGNRKALDAYVAMMMETLPRREFLMVFAEMRHASAVAL